ncbi:hypothetical protein BYT27DRAFT_7186877 [Phlegmacium glaucopus]|nr:hypothetical protein BYT27DRAFT_7186877 [Phlegmacium glaucopus]
MVYMNSFNDHNFQMRNCGNNNYSSYPATVIGRASNDVQSDGAFSGPRPSTGPNTLSDAPLQTNCEPRLDPKSPQR